MAIIWMDGFDHWPNKTEMDQLYDFGNNPSGNLQTSTPFSYGQCYRPQGGAGQSAFFQKHSLAIQSDGIFCLSYNFNVSGSSRAYIQFYDSVGPNVVARVNFEIDGSLTWYRGNNSTLVRQTPASGFVDSTWNWIEIYAKLATDTTGFIRFYLNGTLVDEIENVQTCNTTAASLQFVRWGVNGTSGAHNVDDVFIQDNAGGECGPLGPSRVLTQKPSGDGAETDWLPTPNSYQQIDENTSDGDTTYIYSGAGGNRATFDIEALPYDPAEIHAVQAVWRSRKTDAATRKATCGIISGVTEDPGPEYTQAASYVTRFEDMHELNPDSATGWDRTAVEALQIVIEDTTA